MIMNNNFSALAARHFPSISKKRWQKFLTWLVKNLIQFLFENVPKVIWEYPILQWFETSSNNIAKEWTHKFERRKRNKSNILAMKSLLRVFENSSEINGTQRTNEF